MPKVLFAASCDPITIGHLSLIERGAKLFDQLIIAVSTKPTKRPFRFTLEERMAMIGQVTRHLENVEIVPLEDLSASFAKQRGCVFLLRGLRSSLDFEYEYDLASLNREISGIETFFMACLPQHTHLSSSLIYEIASYGQSIKGLVPEGLEEIISKKFTQH